MNKKDIRNKEKIIRNAINVLKSEFIGIDDVIDNVMCSIRSWYMFPELQEKPVTICLWGLTGCGKTSLVRRICELLEVNGDVLHYNFAKLGEDDSETIESEISDTFSNVKSNRVFVLDEFQYAASLKANGEEKENRQSLKPFWELIDTGIFHYRFSFSALVDLYKLYDTLTTIVSYGMTLEQGRLKGIDRIYNNANEDVKHNIIRLFNWDRKTEIDTEHIYASSCWCNTAKRYIQNDNDFYLSNNFIVEVLDIYSRIQTERFEYGYDDFKKLLSKKTLAELIKFLENVIKRTKSGYAYDYRKSIIFVLGNLDEAYDISYNVDPDMDADQFHAITSKMTLIDIKEALKTRFRNEQIARLGNIMFAYPSFSRQNFIDIINLSLSNYSKMVYDKTKIKIEYDDSVTDIIYKDSVFPTHGTRPIFSSVHEIIKTKLPLVLTHFNTHKGAVRSISYSYADGKIKATIDNGDSVEFVQKLKVDSLRNNDMDERQAITAVHESGHFVMYAKLFGKLPEKLLSKTVSSATNGFMLKSIDDDNDYLSKDDYIKNIKVALGGYAAEKFVFGENHLTSGASKDLEQATVIASRMYKSYGMLSSVPLVQTYLKDGLSTNGGMLVQEDYGTYTDAYVVNNLISECLQDVYCTLKEKHWGNMFKKSAKYLSENISMGKVKMKEVYEEVPAEERDRNVISEHHYRNALENFNISDL